MRAPSDWVPAAVRAKAERIIAQADAEGGRIARLLISDPRMKAVWGTLGHTAPRAGWHEGRHDTEPTNAAESVMVLVLCSCVAAAVCPNVIDTLAELRQWRSSYEKQAAILRRQAKAIRGLDHSGMPDDIEQQALKLDSVVAWCEREAATLREAEEKRDGGIIDRERKADLRREIGMTEMVADTMLWFYGGVLAGTVATIINVMTGRAADRGDGEVLEEHVRGWVRQLRLKTPEDKDA
jgi:hypothetical protein